MGVRFGDLTLVHLLFIYGYTEKATARAETRGKSNMKEKCLPIR
jgi:hypothetical protein